MPLAPESVRAGLRLLTEEDVAGALGLTVRTLQTWRSTGQGPKYRRLGKSVFYHANDLVAWIDGCVVNPVPDIR